jgi:hypothetical protein
VESIVRVIGIALLSTLSFAAVPAGQLAPPIDFRPSLPKPVESALVQNAARKSYVETIQLGPSKSPVRLTWTAFTHEEGTYLVDLHSELLKEAPYDSIRVRDPLKTIINRGTKAAPLMGATVTIFWYQHKGTGARSSTSLGSQSFYFEAGGKHKVL